MQRKGLYPPPPGVSDVLGLEVCGRVIRTGRSDDDREEEDGEEEELFRNPNQKKLHAKNTSGFTGVTLCTNRPNDGSNPYKAVIYIGDSKNTYLGSYDTATKAALAYDRAVIENNLPPSSLNFIHSEYSHTDTILPSEVNPQIGDNICALVPGGAYAEYCLVDTQQAIPVPSNQSASTMACFPETCFTV